MKKIFLSLFFSIFFGAAFGQLSQFRMIGSGSWTTVNDSTFSSTVTIQSDLTSNGFLPTGITDSMFVFTQTGQRYRVSSATNLTFSSADLSIVERGGDWGAPVGQVMIYEDNERTAVPGIPFGATGATAKMQEAVDSYNSIITGNGQEVTQSALNDSTAAIRADIPISAGGVGHAILDNGTPLAQLDSMDFVGSGVSVTNIGTRTTVDISAASGVSEAQLSDSLQGYSLLNASYYELHPKSAGDFSLNAGSTTYWTNDESKVNEADKVGFIINIIANTGGTVDIVWVVQNGGNADILKTQNETVTTGLNEFRITNENVDFSQGQVYIGLKGSATGVVSYTNTGSTGGFFFSTDGGSFTTTSTLYIGYWLGWEKGVLDPKSGKILTATGQQDTSAFDLQTEINNNDFIRLPPYDLNISTTINIPDNKTIVGVKGKTRLVLQNDGVGIQIDGTNNIKLADFTIAGQGSNLLMTDTTLNSDLSIDTLNNLGNEVGIYITGSSGVYNLNISNIHFDNIDGICLDMDAGNNSFRGNGVFTGLSARYCYLGLRVQAGCEYNYFRSLKIYNCWIGAYIIGGNNYLINSNFSNNRIGIVLNDGSNDSHGGVDNTAINHCELYGIYTNGADNGWIFNSCQTWDSIIRIKDSSGIVFSNGIVGGAIEFDDVTFSFFHGNVAPYTNSAFSITETGTNTYSLKNNYRLDGVTTSINN